MMPLMPVTRPLNSANSMTAIPMIAPPASADHGVNVVQSMLTARPVCQAPLAHALQTIPAPTAHRYRSRPLARRLQGLRDARNARIAHGFSAQRLKRRIAASSQDQLTARIASAAICTASLAPV